MFSFFLNVLIQIFCVSFLPRSSGEYTGGVMLEDSPIQYQVKQTAASLGENIKNCTDALYELRRLTRLLLSEVRADDDDIQGWFRTQKFGVDEDGFWTSLPLLAAFRAKQAPSDAISHSWHPKLLQNEDACFRMYCLRNIGPYLAEICQGLPDTAWMYYQDITNTSVQFPYIDQITAITPGFDWRTYHTFLSVMPENNPRGIIQWTNPTIDYAGEGLIVSVSIPVYLEEKFIGLWSIDLPMASLHQDLVFDTFLKDQVNFILDRRGGLVAHPSIEIEIDKDKGSIYQRDIRELGPEFVGLDPALLLEEKSGYRLLKKRHGIEVMAFFEVIPGIEWIYIATFPRRSMEDVVNKRIRKALDRVKSGDLSYRLKDISDIEQARTIVNGFNEMVSALENQENKRQETREEKEKMEKRLQHFQRMEAIGTLAGGIAHDFNNILFPIMGFTEMLLVDLPKDSSQHAMAKNVHHAAERARDLTRQILTFSRQEDLENTAVSFQKIIREALTLLRASIPRDIEILKNIQTDCPPVFGDPTKLHQIVMNLCTNAFHAVQKQSGKFEITLEAVDVNSESGNQLTGLRFGNYVRLSVSDTGHGMDAQTRMQIFDPYFTTKAEGRGTGLGLSVTYGIVQKLNGEIKVYSEPGQGTTFHVYLPQAILADKKTETLEMPVKTGTERILLVDDEVSIVNMGKQVLKKYGYRVTAHVDSLAALAEFKQDPEAFDLVITDMTMPNMTGDILARHIKSLRQDIPVILCTGFSEKISKNNYASDMIDEFLMKPISIKAFHHVIRRLLDATNPREKTK
jgi:signal transduction histidine kinase/CheY-like chemotaxis protein